MKKNSLILLIFVSMMTSQSIAEEVSPAQPGGFQKYFAGMRFCLSSKKIETCLPPKVAPKVKRPADDFSKAEFVDLVVANGEFKKKVASCFASSARIILSYGSTKLFRSAQYACEAKQVNGVWQLTSFYLFFSQE